MAKTERLPAREKRFAELYVVYNNGTKAALEAGYAKKSAHVAASRLIRKDKVVAYINDLRAEATGKLSVLKERMIEELCKIAFLDLTGMYTVDGAFKQPRDWPDDIKAAVCAIEVDELTAGDDLVIGQTKKIKTNSKMEALAQLAKLCGFNAPERKDLTTNGKDLPAPTLGGLSTDELKQLASILSKAKPGK